MEQFNASYSRLDVPKDDDGYVQAFEDPSSKEFIDFFDKYGFAIVKNALKQKECDDTVDELWGYVEKELWRRPGEPCFFGSVRIEGGAEGGGQKRKFEQFEGGLIKCLCAANGRRDTGKTVRGVLQPQDSMEPADSSKAWIALVQMDDEKSAMPKIQKAVEAGCAAVVIFEPSAKLQKLTGAGSDQELKTNTLEALSVPVVSVAILPPTGEEYTLEIDAKGTWTFPCTASDRYSFSHAGIELGVDRQILGRVSRNDPKTWLEKDGWEVDEEGMIGLPPFWTKKALENRSCEALYQAACALLQRKDVVVSHDRLGLFRPMDADVAKTSEEHKKEWATAKNIHLDMNPWKFFGISSPKEGEAEKGEEPMWDWEGDFMREQNGTVQNGWELEDQKNMITKVQGLFNFVDNREGDGGFQCVAGGHKHLREWALATKDSDMAKNADEHFNQIDWIFEGKTDPKDPTCMSSDAQHITMRAGSLLFWNYRTPHGSTPNRSKNHRIAQFFKVGPSTSFSKNGFENRKKIVEQMLKDSGAVTTAVGRKLLGAEEWKLEEEK